MLCWCQEGTALSGLWLGPWWTLVIWAIACNGLPTQCTALQYQALVSRALGGLQTLPSTHWSIAGKKRFLEHGCFSNTKSSLVRTYTSCTVQPRSLGGPCTAGMPLGIIPRGTANAFSVALGIPTHTDDPINFASQAADVILQVGGAILQAGGLPGTACTLHDELHDEQVIHPAAATECTIM